MKLWSSFVKELTIASRGFYFYIEVFMAFILLFVLLFVVPEEFNTKDKEYLYLDFPSTEAYNAYVDLFEDLDNKPEEVVLTVDKEEINALLYETKHDKYYVLESEEDMAKIAKAKHKTGATIKMDEKGEFHFTYYLQGNENDRLKKLLMVLHGSDDAAMVEDIESQEVRTLSQDHVVLTDRENLLPVFLTFNGSLMGFFIMAAYIFLDKKEGVIKAYAVTPSPVWKYLLSKVMVLTTTMLATSLLIMIPIMGTRINYLLIIAFLIPTGFFASALGLLLASFYDDMMKSFGVMYLLMIAMMLPALSYFTPSWDPLWLKFIPSYYIVYGFKEIFIKGDALYVLTIALGYLVVSLILFAFANKRFKKTLSV